MAAEISARVVSHNLANLLPKPRKRSGGEISFFYQQFLVGIPEQATANRVLVSRKPKHFKKPGKIATCEQAG
jgi:hypothetical protein